MTLDTLTRCAYCGDVCEGDRLDDWGEPVCDECRTSEAYRLEMARIAHDMREAIEMEGWR